MLSQKPEILQLIGLSGQATTEAIIAALRRCSSKCSPEFLDVVADLQALEEAIATGLVHGRHPWLVAKVPLSRLPNPPLQNGGGTEDGNNRTLWHTRGHKGGAHPSMPWDVSVNSIAKAGNISVVAHADFDHSRTIASTRTGLGSTALLLENTQDSSVGNTCTGTLTSAAATGTETISPARPVGLAGASAEARPAGGHKAGAGAATVELSPSGQVEAGLSLNAVTASTQEGARRSGSGAVASTERPPAAKASIGFSPLKNGPVWTSLESPAVLQVPQS